MFSMNVDTNRNRFAHELHSMGITQDELTGGGGALETLPLPLDEFNTLIAQFGRPDGYKTEKGALTAWGNLCTEYLEGLAQEQSARERGALRAHEAHVEAEKDKANLPSEQAKKALDDCESTLGKLAADMLAKFRKDNVDYAWHGLVPHVVQYIKLGRQAGRNSVETLAEIRTHVYDLAGYKARAKDKDETKGNLDAEIKAQMDVNTTFENNVTRAVKCGLIAERGKIDIHLGEHDGHTRLLAPYNQMQPRVTIGGVETENKYDHDVPVTIRDMEKLYSVIFQGKQRQAQANSGVAVKDAAHSLVANIGGYRQFKPSVKGDIDSVAQTITTTPEIMAAAVTGSNAAKVFKTMQETIENMDLNEADDETLGALVSLADAIEVVLESATGEETPEAKTA